MQTDTFWLWRPDAPAEGAAMTDADQGYAFPHAAADESRRLQLLEERLDPATIHRIERLELIAGARCLEVGGGRGRLRAGSAAMSDRAAK